VNILGDNIGTVKNNTETLFGDSKEVSVEVNTEKAKCMLLSHHQNAEQNCNVKMANRSFENMAEFKYSRKLY
jgi:hypothetical protein